MSQKQQRDITRGIHHDGTGGADSAADSDAVGLRAGPKLMIVLLALGLFLPAFAGFFTNHKARQNWEKRELAALPNVLQASSSKVFFTELEAFIDDHMGFATPLNQAYRKLQFYVFGDSPVANVSVGDEGFVFLNSHSVSRPHTAISKLCLRNASQISKTAKAMDTFASIIDRQGATMTYAVVPSKPLLYPDRLPYTTPARFREACLSIDPLQSAAGQLRERAQGADYRVYFPFSELAAMRDEPAFYPPENFHSASRINHEFARGLLHELDIDVGRAYSKDAYLGVIRADMDLLGFRRDADAWIYPYADYETVFSHREPSWVVRHYPRARDFGTFVSANPASTRSALLLSNSFGKYVAPHLAPGFKSLHHINLNALRKTEAEAFLRQVLAQIQPDDVIYLVHDGGIPSAQLYMLTESDVLGVAE